MKRSSKTKKRLSQTQPLHFFSKTNVKGCINYALSTLPDFKHLEHTVIFLGVPSTTALTLLKFGLNVLADLLCEWLTWFKKTFSFSQISHFAISKHLLMPLFNRSLLF